jgi:hypothetical protein
MVPVCVCESSVHAYVNLVSTVYGRRNVAKTSKTLRKDVRTIRIHCLCLISHVTALYHMSACVANTRRELLWTVSFQLLTFQSGNSKGVTRVTSKKASKHVTDARACHVDESTTALALCFTSPHLHLCKALSGRMDGVCWWSARACMSQTLVRACHRRSCVHVTDAGACSYHRRSYLGPPYLAASAQGRVVKQRRAKAKAKAKAKTKACILLQL